MNAQTLEKLMRLAVASRSIIALEHQGIRPPVDMRSAVLALQGLGFSVKKGSVEGGSVFLSNKTGARLELIADKTVAHYGIAVETSDEYRRLTKMVISEQGFTCLENTRLEEDDHQSCIFKFGEDHVQIVRRKIQIFTDVFRPEPVAVGPAAV